MAKRVFFSFHYQDVIDFRANVVRKHDLTKEDREDAGFFDASIWETAHRTGAAALTKLINAAVEGTTVTCVLIGSETFSRRWVRYEIFKSMSRGNKIFGVHINGVKDRYQATKLNGQNPFDYLGLLYSADGFSFALYEIINNEWKIYSDFSGYTFGTQAPIERRGKFFKLSEFYRTYDWNVDNGYQNFSTWVG